MEGFNKILSLFIGLFVVIIVMFLVVKRFGLQQKWPLFGGSSETKKKVSITTSPTPTITKVVINTTSDSIKEKFNNTTTYKGTSYQPLNKNEGTVSQTYTTSTNQAQSIPETGAPTVLLPLMLSGLTAGLYLRKKS